MNAYVIMIDDEWYGYIAFYKWSLALRKVNQRKSKCIECEDSFEAGECVYHSQYGGNGFVCIPCARKLIIKHGDMGYSENILMNLQANNFQTGKWTAEQIAQALHKDTIEDGFGSIWSAYCEKCENRSMQVVRPGIARCAICEE